MFSLGGIIDMVLALEDNLLEEIDFERAARIAGIMYSFNAFCKVVIRYAAINGRQHFGLSPVDPKD